MPPVWSIPDHDKPVVVRLEAPALRRKVPGGDQRVHRPHKRLSEPAGPSNRDILERYTPVTHPATVRIRHRKVLGGLIREYERAV